MTFHSLSKFFLKHVMIMINEYIGILVGIIYFVFILNEYLEHDSFL